jgi:hypothetical protein
MQRDEFRPPLWYVVDKWVVWGASISQRGRPIFRCLGLLGAESKATRDVAPAVGERLLGPAPS